MQLARNMGRPQRLVYFFVGFAMVAYALIAWDVNPWLLTLLLLAVGLYFLWAARSGH